MRVLTIIIAVCFAASTVAISQTDDEERQTYDGYKVFRLNVTNNEVFNALTDLQRDGSWDFWTEPRLNSSTDLMVSPEQMPVITELIKQFNVEHEFMFDSLEQAISRERKTSLNRFGNEMNWNSYQRLDTIYSWMDSLVQSRRVTGHTFKVEVLTIGETYEKRPMKLLKVSWRSPRALGVKRSAIWLEGGIHAREWIAPATVTYIANEIIEANIRSEQWATLFDWYIIPCANPDGYEYSHTRDRLWRKTRSRLPPGTSLLTTMQSWCVGADPNRNYNFHWGGLGASLNPCAPNFRGTESASEIEVQNIQNFMLSKKDELKLYLTLHSYSQIILLPWGHSYVYADDYDELLTVARKAAIRVYKVQGTNYRTGATPYVLYPASGGSHDWAKGVAGIKYSYTVELPDRGFYGFLLPAWKIKSVGEETLELVKSMAEDMTQVYYYSKKNTTMSG